MSKTTVLVVGTTGSTGRSTMNALLASSNFNVIAAVRPSSLEKPIIKSFQSRGADVVALDLATATSKHLVELLKGVDIVVSTIEYSKLKLQYPLIDAAKEARVKRFIPSDWSPACIKGERRMHDEKLAIHEYIIRLGLGYTFIDAGYWFTLPPVDAAPLSEPSAYHLSLQMFGTGDVKYATIHLADIGPLVARILLDERTLNKYVFPYADEVTQNEVLCLARLISGKPLPTMLHVTEEEVKGLVRKTGAQVPESEFEFAIWEYVLSIWYRGDNTMENARRKEYGGALDAKELYPDVRLKRLEEYGKEFYNVDSE